MLMLFVASFPHHFFNIYFSTLWLFSALWFSLKVKNIRPSSFGLPTLFQFAPPFVAPEASSLGALYHPALPLPFGVRPLNT